MAKGEISINRELCKGCLLCTEFCPRDCIAVSKSLNKKGYYPAEFQPGEDKKSCTGCTLCATVCPDMAIEVFRE